MWPTIIFIMRISMGSRKLLWFTIIRRVFNVPWRKAKIQRIAVKPKDL